MYQDKFQEIFDTFTKASEEGQDIFPEWEPINFSNPEDMAAFQKVLGIEGATKVHNFSAIAAQSNRQIL